MMCGICGLFFAFMCSCVHFYVELPFHFLCQTRVSVAGRAGRGRSPRRERERRSPARPVFGRRRASGRLNHGRACIRAGLPDRKNSFHNVETQRPFWMLHFHSIAAIGLISKVVSYIGAFNRYSRVATLPLFRPLRRGPPTSAYSARYPYFLSALTMPHSPSSLLLLLPHNMPAQHPQPQAAPTAVGGDSELIISGTMHCERVVGRRIS